MDRQREQSSQMRTLPRRRAVFAGCYLGASVDVWIRFPDIGAAILFLPYAIVTAVLWRASPRRWWIFLLAGSLGDLHPHRLGGATVAFALGAEVVNWLRAVLAAIGLRRFVGRSGRLESLRRMVVYLVVAVLLAPGVAALGGAWLVTATHRSPSFWLAFQQWWFSNAITGLTLLPLLAFDVGKLRERLRAVSPRMMAEAWLLALMLLAAGALVFARSYDRSHTHQAHLYWALPFLLWAIRFGPRGTSAALLAVTLMSIWGAINGRGPFAARAPTANLLELQLFLLAVSVPLLLLAALFAQQRGTAAALHREPAPVPLGRRGPDRDDLPLPPGRHLHLRQPRLLRRALDGVARDRRKHHLGAGARGRSPDPRRAGGHHPELAHRHTRGDGQRAGELPALAAVAGPRLLRRARRRRRVPVRRTRHHRSQEGGGRAAGARGAQVGRGRAARGRPAQGRVPGHAGARAAQPAGADRHRAGDPAPGAARRPGRAVGARVDRPAAGADDPAGRRPARHLAHHAGQDPAAAGRASTSAR